VTAAPNLHPVDRVIDKLRDGGYNPKASGPGQWEAKCPNLDGHRNGDKNPSLSVGTGSDGKVLMFCHKGCRLPDIAQHLNLNVNDLFPPRTSVSSIEGGRRITATYDYYAESGEHIFQVVRYTPKGFGQRRKGPDGRWINKINDVVTARPLYMLPQVRKAIEDGKRIFMTEGEKDAEALQWATQAGAATCNSGGAGKWRDEYAHQLRGAKRITLFQDNDAKGLEHVKIFAGQLLAAGFTDIDVMAPPLPHKDVAEALGAGKGASDFVHVWDNSEDMSWLIVDPQPDPDTEPEPESETPSETEVGEDWLPIDLAPIARQISDGTYQPTMPTIMEVAGTIPLFYRERVNLLFGESGGGKTWLALAAVAETLATGQRVMFVDYEDNPNGIAERMMILNVPIEQLSLLDYRNPSSGLMLGTSLMSDIQQSYALVVLDSTGEAMAAGGVNSNDDGEVAQWFALVKRFLKLPGKPAVVTLDHVPKNQEGQLLFSIGSQRKRAAVTGASYRVDTLKEPAKGKDGKLKLTVAKDRPGNRPKGSTACHVDLKSTDGHLTIEAVLEGPSVDAEGNFRPTVLMERVSRWLEDNPQSTAREVREGVTGKTTVVTEALAVLVREGSVRVVTGPRGASIHTVAKPYREADELVLNDPKPNPGSLVPSGSLRLPGTQESPETTGSLVPPLTRGTRNQSDSPPGDRFEPNSVAPDESSGSHTNSAVPTPSKPPDLIQQAIDAAGF
jgi:hypothetical protein